MTESVRYEGDPLAYRPAAAERIEDIRLEPSHDVRGDGHHNFVLAARVPVVQARFFQACCVCKALEAHALKPVGPKEFEGRCEEHFVSDDAMGHKVTLFIYAEHSVKIQ